MQILQQTKWFGVSLVLHLAAITGLIAVAAHNAERPPETLMVILDNFEMPPQPHSQAAKIPVRAIVRPESPVVSAAVAAPQPVELKPAMAQPLYQPVAMPAKATEHSPVTVPQQTPVERPAAVPLRPVPATPESPAARPTVPAGRTTQEKAQQHYLKEHFVYIRNLINSRLVYPPMARRMNWSGRVVVAFTIAEDGTIHELRVAESSGFPLLDRGALDTVRDTAPFPRPPVRAEITVPIQFRMMK